jgi:hypothetical protein
VLTANLAGTRGAAEIPRHHGSGLAALRTVPRKHAPGRAARRVCQAEACWLRLEDIDFCGAVIHPRGSIPCPAAQDEGLPESHSGAGPADRRVLRPDRRLSFGSADQHQPEQRRNRASDLVTGSRKCEQANAVRSAGMARPPQELDVGCVAARERLKGGCCGCCGETESFVGCPPGPLRRL